MRMRNVKSRKENKKLPQIIELKLISLNKIYVEMCNKWIQKLKEKKNYNRYDAFESYFVMKTTSIT